MPAERGLLTGGVSLPELDGLVITARSKGFAIRGEGQGADRARMPAEGAPHPPAGHVPKQDRPVRAPPGQKSPRRGIGHGGHRAGMPAQRESMPLVAKAPKVIPFEAAQVLLTGPRPVSLQQRQRL